MNIKCNEIREMTAKTYAYLSTPVIGLGLCNVLFLSYGLFSRFQEFLTYRNGGDDLGGKLHYVNINEIYIQGGLCLLFLILLILVSAFWAKKVRSVEKKFPVIATSVCILVVCIPLLAAMSLFCLEWFLQLLT